LALSVIIKPNKPVKDAPPVGGIEIQFFIKIRRQIALATRALP
jgi:hypothetical protein